MPAEVLAYPEGFTPLFAARCHGEPVAAQCHGEPVAAQCHGEPVAAQDDTSGEESGALRELALFRATLRDLVEARLETLLCAIAAEVLGRELALAPPEVRTIVDRALVRHAGEVPADVFVCANDAPALEALGVRVRIDPALRRGDVRIAVAGGVLESSLWTRLAHVVQELAP